VAGRAGLGGEVRLAGGISERSGSISRFWALPGNDIDKIGE
jgi:hypothetical protein